MRKLYVVPKDVWLAHSHLFSPQIGSHYLDLVENPEDVTSHEDIQKAWKQGNDIDGNMVLVSTTLEHSEWAEDFWEGLGAVAVLPHPTFEGNVPMSEVSGNKRHEAKKVRKEHMDALKKHKGLGFTESDTVLDIARKAQAVNPQVRIRGLR